MSARHLSVPPTDHLEHVLLDAEHRLLRDDWNEGLRSVVHAIFVAGTAGRGTMTEVELGRWVSRLYDAGRLPDGPGAA